MYIECGLFFICMNNPLCNNCHHKMSKNGHTNAGTTRYRCTNCGASKSRAYDKQSNDLTVGLNWLLSNKTQDKYSYDFSARTLRRKNKLLWDLWPQVPFVDKVYDYIHVDGIHLGRKSVVQVIIKKPS